MKLAKRIAFREHKGIKSIIAGLFMTAAAGAIAGQGGLKPLDWSTTPGMGKNLLAGSSIAEGDHYSAGDFYYWQGKRIPLYRSLTEYAVQFQEGLNQKTQQAIIETISPLAEMTEHGKIGNQALSVITLKTKAKEPAAIEEIIDTMKARFDVRWAVPVFIHAKTGSRMLITDEIVVRLKPGKDLTSLDGLLQSYGLLLIKPMWGTQNEYVLRLQDPKAVNPLEAANALFESGLVEWAQPNFIQEYKRSFTPNDPRLSRQWHLTGTDNGTPTPGHARALKAWDITLGSPDITIAVLDDGVQRDHPDLAGNIFINPGEIPGDGVDNDSNGFIDDVSGWDFSNNDNDPSPFIGLDDPPDGDVHGTAVAGV